MRFDSYHPAVSFLFFTAALVFTVLFNHPGFIAASWLFALGYLVCLRRAKGLALGCGMLLLALLWGLWFAANEHFGLTVLCYTPWGNQVTVEALAAGLCQGAQLTAVLLWLACAVAVFTTDKVVYLLGRVWPKLALMVAIIARAVPCVAQQARRVSVAQRGVGRGAGQGSLAERFVNFWRRASTLLTWAIERFAQMSDSMRARGSNLRGRSAFSIYRFDNRDRLVVLFFVFAVTVCAVAFVLDQTTVLFSPQIVFNKTTCATYAFWAIYALFLATPLYMECGSRLQAR